MILVASLCWLGFVGYILMEFSGESFDMLAFLPRGGCRVWHVVKTFVLILLALTGLAWSIEVMLEAFLG